MANKELTINIELKGNIKNKSIVDILQLETFIKDLLINNSDDQLEYFFKDYYDIKTSHKEEIPQKNKDM